MKTITITITVTSHTIETYMVDVEDKVYDTLGGDPEDERDMLEGLIFNQRWPDSEEYVEREITWRGV